MPITRTHKSPQTVESNFAWLAFFANAIPSLLLVAALWWYGVPVYLLGIIVFFLAFLTLYTVITVWKKAQYQFRTLHNLLESLVQGNYSFRGRVPGKNSALGDLVDTINSLADTLQKQKLQSEESLLLLDKVVDQIDVAIIAWDQHDAIQLCNPAARELLGFREGSGAISELPEVLARFKTMGIGETQVHRLDFGGKRGRFRVHMEEFIAEGNRHRLLFMTDISNILRKEEKKAWLNLIRVLSHEINNSLAPLSSLGDSLRKQIARREKDPELAGELMQGMAIISKRAESLAEFVQSYHKISKLPDPQKQPADISQVFDRLARLFPQHDISLAGAPVPVLLDVAQIEQALINLLKNAMEAGGAYASQHAAAREPVVVRWWRENARLLIRIIDGGEGVDNPENLFTPFYTTKTKGSGVGLVLSQQIIEAHGGSLGLANREDDHGCVVTIELPAEPEGFEALSDVRKRTPVVCQRTVGKDYSA